MNKRFLEVHLPYDRYELLNHALESGDLPVDQTGKYEDLYIGVSLSKEADLVMCVGYSEESDEVLAYICVCNAETGKLISMLHEDEVFPWRVSGKTRELNVEFLLSGTIYSVIYLVDFKAKSTVVLTKSGKKSRSATVYESDFFDA